MKKFYRIKWENILIILFIPLAIMQFIKANNDYKLLSVLMSLTLYGGFYLSIRVGRKETLQDIKKGVYEPLIDLEELAEYLRIIKDYIRALKKAYKGIKKEITKQAIYKRPSLYIKSVF